ncbi:MAG: hypothetical protein J6333_08530, partial [Planctomycetes bacterium]|nr:hypothetical protein [Planctomycetota bacterium]
MIPARFPGSVTVSRGDRARPVYFAAANRFVKGGGAAIASLAFSLHVPANLPAGARLSATVFLNDKDGRWYQATPRWENGGAATALSPGWNRLCVDLTEAAAMFRPVGHGAGWTRYRLSQAVQVGVTIDCDAAFAGLLALDDFLARPALPETRPLAFVNLRFPATTTQNRLCELALNVNRELINPFSPAEIDIVADFFAPGGGAPSRVPAFYYQDYRREKGVDDGSGDLRDRYVPVGPGEFRVRYLPPAPGRYLVRLRATYVCPFTGATTTCVSPDYEFDAAANPDPVAARRFVRVSPRDPRAFEFSNGEWFYPTGLNMHNPMDVRYNERIVNRFFPGRKPLVDRGLRCYEDAFPAMQQGGMNVFEVWMSSWWLTLEWTSRWKGFHGLGRYNLENAWKLDSLLASAAEHGLYAHLVVDNHGKGVDRRGHEAEWPHSPYNLANSQDDGVCRSAAELFSSEKAMAYYRDLYRYLAARWGWCPNIFGVEMWSELNLVNANVRSETMYAWHAAMEKAFHEWDQGQHLMTTHYSGDYNTIDLEMDRRPHIGYIVGDAYHGDNHPLARMLDGTDARLHPMGKPFMMTEFGGNWDAASLEGLFGDVFGGLWVSWTSRAAGAPLCWWYDYVLQEGLCRYYAAFRRYAAGEDKRRAADEPQLTLDWGAAASAPGDQEKMDAARQEAEADKAEQTRLLAEFNRRNGELAREVAERRAGRERANRELTV